MNRYTPLRRTPMKRRRARRIDDMTPEDRAYLDWLHEQLCYGSRFIAGHVCEGPIQQAHLRDHTGLGRKEPAQSSAPFCRGLHTAYDQHSGMFLGWGRATRIAWMREAVAISAVDFRAGRVAA